MSIRCAELGIPAAIGCGHQSYSNYEKTKLLELNCKSKSIK